MNFKKYYSLLLLFCLCVGSAELESHAFVDPNGDAKLQQVLLEFCKGVDSKIDDINETSMAILNKLSQIGMKPCVFEKAMKSKMDIVGSKVDHALQDILTDHQQLKDNTKSIISNYLGKTELNRTEMAAVDSLARTIAANELSLSEIRQKIIPDLMRENRQFLNELDSFESKISLLKMSNEARLQSLCNRVSQLESQVSVLRNASHSRPSAAINTRYATNSASVEMQHSETMTYQRAVYAPSAYFADKELCGNAKLLQANCAYDAQVIAANGVVLDRMIGDLYWDCSQQVVMVLRKHGCHFE